MKISEALRGFLHDFDKVLFFTGAKQENIKIPVTSLSSAISVCIIPATEVSKNNVDFHLVLELGQLTALSGDTSHFSVISRDKGYDGIIARLKAAGSAVQGSLQPCPLRSRLKTRLQQ
ncbi:PIN domain-containing protein (plasmid) [Serratia ureilytica]